MSVKKWATWEVLFTVTACGLSIFHVWTSYTGVLEAWRQRSIHLGLVMMLVFMMGIMKSRKEGAKPLTKVANYLIFFLAVAVALYMFLAYPGPAMREGRPSQIDILVGIALMVLVMEGTRRLTGWPIIIITGGFLVYLGLGPLIPARWGHPGFTLSKVIDSMFNTTQGILGVAVGAMAVYVFIFMLFGAFLEESQASEFFIKVAYKTTANVRGGPALAAVMSSALVGMITGAASANVATTGTFTIPLMKRLGYSPEDAGGIEAAASTGSMVMPPVMGSTAFIMAQMTGIPYIKIAQAALLPAILYFTCVGAQVLLKAYRDDIGKPDGKTDMGNTKQLLMEGTRCLVPLFALLYFLVSGSSPMKAGAIATACVFFLSFTSKATAMTPKRIVRAFERAARNTLSISIVCGTAGIISGVVSLTGLGFKLCSVVVAAGQSGLYVALFLVAIISIVMGMALPAVSCYTILAVLSAPPLVRLGVPIMVAHLFIMWYGVLSNVTPPVALASYTAAGLAGGSPMGTGFAALKFSTMAFLAPAYFILNPALMMIGSIPVIVRSLASALVGVMCLSIGLEGWFLRKQLWFERALFVGLAILSLMPNWTYQLAAFVGFLALAYRNLRLSKGGGVSGEPASSV